MNVAIMIDGDPCPDRTTAVRHLTGIPEINGMGRYYPVRVEVGIPENLADRPVFRRNAVVTIYPRRMQFGEIQPPQVSTSGLTRGLDDAELYGVVYAYAVSLAREAQDLAEIYERIGKETEGELAAKAKAVNDLYSAPPRIEQPLHPLGTDLSEPSP